MQKREWLISLCLLCVLALVSAGITAFVLRQNEPARVEAFENRFLDLTQLGLTAPETVSMQVEERRVTLDWPEGQEKLEVFTQAQPLGNPCETFRLTLGGGGAKNGYQKERWGYQVFLTLEMLSGETVISAEMVEMPLLADRADRTRIYTIQANAVGADRWRLRVSVEPEATIVAHGSLVLNNWEVSAR